VKRNCTIFSGILTEGRRRIVVRYYVLQELYGKVRSLLNKLTPQNFKTLMGQLKSFDLNTEARLNKALDIIFEKV
jgi:hypothetical protein